MTTDVLEKPQQQITDVSGDDTVHWLVCGDPTRALCGLDVSGHFVVSEDTDITCVVCIDLQSRPCGEDCVISQ